MCSRPHIPNITDRREALTRRDGTTRNPRHGAARRFGISPQARYALVPGPITSCPAPQCGKPFKLLPPEWVVRRSGHLEVWQCAQDRVLFTPITPNYFARCCDAHEAENATRPHL